MIRNIPVILVCEHRSGYVWRSNYSFPSKRFGDTWNEPGRSELSWSYRIRGLDIKSSIATIPASLSLMPRRDVWGLGALITESLRAGDPLVKWHKLNEPVVHKSLDYYGGHFLYHL
jgi:hypothetical protein